MKIRELYQSSVPHLREAGDGSESRIIEGYAILFGVPSVTLVDWCDKFREIIEPGAITQEDLLKYDVQMTMWHDREKLLARWTEGSGTLQLRVDEKGLRYSFEAPRTATGDEALELVRRGDIRGASFCFTADEEEGVRYAKDDDGTIFRHVLRISGLYDTTLASTPAYPQTTASAREIPAGAAALLESSNASKDISVNLAELARLRRVAEN